MSAQNYYVFGNIRGTTGTVPTDFGFTGQRRDVSAGLMYYGARYYDSALGRFVSADSVVPNAGNPQALNRYAYVYNNPLRYTDPTGHGSPFEDVWTWLKQTLQLLVNAGEQLQQRAIQNACGNTVSETCGSGVRNLSTGSQTDAIKQAFKNINQSAGARASQLGTEIDPTTLKAIGAMTDAADRIVALNEVFGSLPDSRVEEGFWFNLKQRDSQLDEFTKNYFPDLSGVDVVYGGDLGAGRAGRFCAAGVECFGVIYRRDTIVVGEEAFRAGWGDVGMTIFHEWLHKLHPELDEQQIRELEPYWLEWFKQQSE